MQEVLPPERSLEVEALIRNVRASMEKAINLGKNISPEVMAIIANLDDAGRLADLSASNLELKVEDAQSVLDIADTTARLRRVNELLNKEIEVLTVQQEINTQARADIDRSQREFYLRQQMKAIQSELGEGNELAEEIAQFREKIEAAKHAEAGRRRSTAATEETRAHASGRGRNSDAAKLDGDHDRSAVVESFSLTISICRRPKRILNEDHYGLEKVKDRIIEALAVRKLKEKPKGPDPLSSRPAGRRQDFARPLDRASAGSKVCAAVAGRRARRSGDSRTSPNLRRRDAGTRHSGDSTGRHKQSADHARRDRQGRRGFSRRSVVGAAGSARSGTEQSVSATTISA